MSENYINVWGESVPLGSLSDLEFSYIEQLPKARPDVEWVWREMDRIWHNLNLNNREFLASQNIADFYSHPVWLMNGIFTATDPVSRMHREKIAQFIHEKKIKKVADYGGGFGELALTISRINGDTEISIVEPYPSRLGMERLKGNGKIHVIPELVGRYEVVVAQDVLEHVENPVHLACALADSVEDQGFVIFANCFDDCIQCHLPSTFYLRHTFKLVMKALGLEFVAAMEQAEHVQIFRKSGKINLKRARMVAGVSKIFGFTLNALVKIKRNLRGLVKKLTC